jgi:chemotaxis protein MotB
MSGKKPREMSESGMLVYPQLPMPKPQRESEARMPKRGPSGFRKVMSVVAVLMLLAAAAGGFMLRPYILEDQALVDTKKELANEKLAHSETQQKITALEEAAKKGGEERELLGKQLDAAKQATDAIADKQADAAKLKADLEAAKKKLDATGAGSTSIEGNELHLVISDGKLFKSGDELASGGEKVLDKIAGVLKELPDKQVAVNGHTDDQPPPKPKAPKSKDKKAPPTVAPEPEFATNWELSSARALAVVHYFQDEHKIEATRLSAHAFSQYRPISKNRNANRRVELVLTPKPAKR